MSTIHREVSVMSDIPSMAPRVALVTGGTAGIGAAICEALRAAGYAVAANYADRHDLADAFFTRTGIPVFSWNVADLAACQDGVAKVQAQLGAVDVLVNNAGITRDAMLHKMSAEQWRNVIDVDLGGCFNMCRVLIEGMRERRFGRIVNISSVNALSGQAGQTNYAAAKAGMLGFTRSLALEGATRNVTVNAIAPGYTDTAMVSAVRPDILEQILESCPGRSPRRAGRDRARRRLSCRRRRRLHHRHHAVHQRRQAPGLTNMKTMKAAVVHSSANPCGSKKCRSPTSHPARCW